MMDVRKNRLMGFFERKEKPFSGVKMDFNAQANRVIICEHQLRPQGCRVCQMRTFLLCRKQIHPFLVRDACTLIFAWLPKCLVVAPPARGTCYELEHCGKSRIPLNQSAEGAVCGVAFRRNECPYLLYCLSPAIKQGASGLWSCSAHCKRPNPDPTGRSGKMTCTVPRLSGFGINYTYAGELPSIRVGEVVPARIPTRIIVDFGVRNNGQGSIEVHDQAGSTKVTASRAELAGMNMPGREVFGPLNETERQLFLKHVKGIQRIAAMSLMQNGNEEMRKIIQDISPLFVSLMNDTCSMGSAPLTVLLNGYTERLQKALEQPTSHAEGTPNQS